MGTRVRSNGRGPRRGARTASDGVWTMRSSSCCGTTASSIDMSTSILPGSTEAPVSPAAHDPKLHIPREWKELPGAPIAEYGYVGEHPTMQRRQQGVLTRY